MERNIILSADSTCDLGGELKKRYHVHYCPYHIILDDQQYTDGLDITPDDLYEAYWERRALPKTAAISMMDYHDFFEKWVAQGYDVVHLCLSSGISSSYQNCCNAARELGHVYPIDTKNLSTGMAILAIEAAKCITSGMTAPQVQQTVTELTAKTHVSFVLDTLEFMRAGGRCSTLAALGANLLRLKPCIEVNNQDGNMNVGKKYRGTLEKALLQYTKDKIMGRTDIRRDRIFITHSGISQERIQLVRKAVQELVNFSEVYIIRACCTISCHCGPNTLGLIFMTK